MPDTALQLLLRKLASERALAPIPEPAAPLSLGPLSEDTTAAYGALNPEPVPPRFAEPAPVDESFVNQYAGAEPVRPTIQPASKLQRIAAALTGFGMGFEGRGPEYLNFLREQREAPIRRYEQQRERYDENRRRGIELSLRQSEQEADRANRMAEIQYEREFKIWQQKLGIRANEADERTRQAFEIYKLDRQMKAEEARQRRIELRERENEARHISDQFFSLTKDKNLSDEIGAYRAGLSDKGLSPAATALYNKVTRLGEVQMRHAFSAGSGGGSGAGNSALRAAQEVESAKGALIQLMQRGGSVRDERLIRRRIDKAVGRLRAFPGRLQGGLDAQGWPWVQIMTPQGWTGIAELYGGAPDSQQPQQQQQQQGPMTFNLAQPQAASPARVEAKRKLLAVGYSDAEAEAELNRLGVQ